LVILRGAQAHAAFHRRDSISDDDIILAAELALPHRIKTRPFQESAVSAYELEERLEQVQSEFTGGELSENAEETEESPVGKKKV
jgi:Mg-chelatase subunit ChlI